MFVFDIVLSRPGNLFNFLFTFKPDKCIVVDLDPVIDQVRAAVDLTLYSTRSLLEVLGQR